jgi:hypothetical protein
MDAASKFDWISKGFASIQPLFWYLIISLNVAMKESSHTSPVAL